jgi:hypothetical protein
MVRVCALIVTFCCIAFSWSALGMEAVELTVRETGGADRAAGPVTTGVPFAKGALRSVDGLAVEDGRGTRLPCAFRAISSWEDGSVRWALMDTQVDVKANEGVGLKVVRGGATPAPGSPVQIAQTDASISVSTGPLRFSVSKKSFNVFQSLTVNGKELIVKGSPGLVLYPGPGRVVANGAPKEIVVEESNPLRAVVLVRGVYPKVHKGLLRYTVRITACAGKPFVHLRVYLENDGKYGYVGRGEWFEFDGQAVELDLGLGDVKAVHLDGERVAGGTSDFRVVQHNPKGNFDGFACTAMSEGEAVKQGGRTRGLVTFDGANGSLTLGVRYFWENYSKAISLKDRRLRVELWPTDGEWPVVRGRWRNRGGGDFRQFVKRGVYHIPGCVHKGHEILLDFRGAPERAAATLRAPLMALAGPDYYARTEAAPGWFAPASFKTGDAPYDKAVANWDKQARNGVDRNSGSSIWKAREGRVGPIRDWYGWMNFGDNGWGGGFSSLHYDWPWIMFLNYLRQGDRRFFDLGVTMVRHLIEVDHLWSTRNHKMLQQMARFEFCSPYTHGGLAGGRCKPTPSHVWISGVILYYMLTGDPMAKECALSTDRGLELRLVSRLRKGPTTRGQARSSGWGMLVYCSLYDLTGEKKYLDKGLVLFRNHQKPKWKAKGPYHDQGLQYYYCTQGLCELQHRTGDAELMEMLAAACEGDVEAAFARTYSEWPAFLANVFAYVGHKKGNDEYIAKAKALFERYKPGGSPACFRRTGAWDKETGKFIRNGHILQHVLWKRERAKE